MKRTTFFIAISSLSLLAVLIIQVNWIQQTARAKEEMFSEKANMVLARTTEALLSDEITCDRLRGCMGKEETHTIDSLFRHYMDFYDFHVAFTFQVVQPSLAPPIEVNGFSQDVDRKAQACYDKELDKLATETGMRLKLVFPEKKQFILAEMGMLFITSVFLVLIVLILFWLTSRSLLREKQIAEHTTEFLNNITHEFKTPMTNIALAGKMIAKDSEGMGEKKLKHYSDIILQENEKLRQQVEQVLSMAALERGEIPLHIAELDLHQLIRDAARSMSVQIENRNGKMDLNLNATQTHIMGDKVHLTNAFCSLVDNAIKYSPGEPELRILTSDKQRYITIDVSDKGIGIEKEYHQRVFEKFFRVPTRDVHDVKGFGLGLAYIRKIVELHGGSITLVSEKGMTTFTILLPHV